MSVFDIGDGCCYILFFGVILYVIIQITNRSAEKEAKRNHEIIMRINIINDHRRALTDIVRNMTEAIMWSFNSAKKDFVFSDSSLRYHNFLREGSYSQTEAFLKGMVNAGNSHISKMKETNTELAALSSEDDQKAIIEIAELDFISKAETMVWKYAAFGKKISSVSAASRIMVDINQAYGKVNEQYLKSITALAQQEQPPMGYISQCFKLLDTDRFDDIYQINVERVLKCIWLFAMQKPHNADIYKKARSVFFRIYKRTHVDIFLADFYLKKQLGGEAVLSELVQSTLKNDYGPYMLNTLASGLMWMQAYNSEKMVLQYMVANNKQMTSAAQARIKMLTDR